VELWDLSAQFYFAEEDVGKSRALACAENLKHLNAAVEVRTSTTGDVTENSITSSSSPTSHTAVEVDDFCHHHDPPISFMPPCELGTTVSLRSTSWRRMIPAIATTTATATGLVDLLELYKALQLEQNVERYSDTFANLALPLV
jgi:molybdopterin/thiamine biosynthesis adenylyltransferase